MLHRTSRRGGRSLAAALRLGTCALAISAASAVAVPAFAQETTSSMTGLVLLPDGNAASGALVEITHTPSGTRSIATVNAEGRFSASGLRVGGPYTVAFAAQGLPRQIVEGVFIRLGEPTAIDLVLEGAGQQQAGGAIEEIVVTGDRIASQLAGAGSQYGQDQINRAPTISRDLKDVIRADPKVNIGRSGSNEVNIAGSNSRFNSFTVDGIRQGDDFGLNFNGFPTQRVPVSLDAIDQIAVNIAPFDVEYSRFQGGNINVVTKSGGNEFSGSAYYYYTDDSLAGDEINGRPTSFVFEDKTYGGTLGGPIIQDTLFFFLNYEKFETSSPVTSGPAGSAFANQVREVSQAQFDQVLDITRRVYGFDPGTLLSDLPVEDEKILGKIDWNINDQHRASFTYQRTEGNEIIQSNNGGRNVSASSQWYNRSILLEQYSAQIFSDWTSDFSTELKVGRKETTTGQDSLNGTNFPSFRITTRAPGATQDGFIFVGPDVFRHANSLRNDLNQVKLVGRYQLGDHELKAGWEYEDLEVFNLFVPRSRGEYNFNSIADFEARRAASLRFNNAVSGNVNDGAAAFSYKLNSFYVQDKYVGIPDLELTAGLRYETYSSNDDPALNTPFQTRNGFANTNTLDGKDVFLPRFGAKYDLSDRTVVRGGVGLYSGGTPNVWISNSYSNTGVITDEITIDRARPTAEAAPLVNVALNNVGSTIPPAVQSALVAGDGAVNAIDQGFEVPSSWRYNLAVDHEFDLGALGDGWNVTAEVVFTQVNEGLTYRDARLTRIGQAPDGRPIYSRAGSVNSSVPQDLILTNSSEGEALVLSLDFDKTWEFDASDLSLSGGYAYTDIKEQNPLNSTTASSGFDNMATADFNNLETARGEDEVQHRFTWTASYRVEPMKGFRTTFSLFGEHKSGQPFSAVFANRTDVAAQNEFGDSGTRARSLFYVPTGANDPLVRLSGLNQATFDEWLAATGLDSYRGQIVPRNALSNDWEHFVDLQVQQEIPAFFEGHRAVIQLDVFNVLNLIDSEWGEVSNVGSLYNTGVVADIVGNQYVYSGTLNLPDRNIINNPAQNSVWRIQLGVRYEF